MSELTTIAANMVSPSAHIRIKGAIDFFRLSEDCESFLLAFRNPHAEDYSIIAQHGYSASIAGYLTSDIQNLPEFRRQFREYESVVTWEDCPDFSDSPSGVDVLRPAGFNNGLLMILHDDWGRTIGMCQGNTGHGHFTRDSKALLESMRPTFTDYARRHHETSRFALTPREQEILDLLRKGMSNADIGEELVLSARTVSTHVERIFRKLGVSNRVAAAMLAADTCVPQQI